MCQITDRELWAVRTCKATCTEKTTAGIQSCQFDIAYVKGTPDLSMDVAESKSMSKKAIRGCYLEVWEENGRDRGNEVS